MKISINLLAFLVSLHLIPDAVLAFQGQSTGQAAKYGWLSDYKAAKALARQTGKPIMVVFRCVP